jgi:hypothetical protein
MLKRAKGILVAFRCACSKVRSRLRARIPGRVTCAVFSKHRGLETQGS